ncbi:hypothetical protein OEJ84_17120 [Bacillus subtilis]|uniref:hypothetical protein n=1 Tax=Bacillus subtilis TaxID=1423 RepID=UPI0029390C2F|nr:hypothetical protein [Bacillus subtilis]WNA14169.1 hypothetical protein phi182_01 [Bacillus phage phi18-2]WOF29620.1 hypothetical protein OEJ84_17120 [Bacillus subtilis]
MRESKRDQLALAIEDLNAYLDDEKFDVESVYNTMHASFYTDENGEKQYADDIFSVITVRVSRK